MTLTDTLTAWGIVDAADVVTIAAQVGLPLAAACALLDKESEGGHNVWGHDNVTVAPGTYVKGGPVTELNYRAFRVAWATGRAGQQGCGPTQLTSVGYQDQADALGGCWIPTANLRVGFGLLAGYQARWGLADAFRAYNGGAGDRVAGSNVNADEYSVKAMALYSAWTTRLGSDDSMAITQADADLIVRTLLNTPLADLYPDHPTGNMTLAATLQWAAANSGRALTVAQRVRDLIQTSSTASADVKAELLAAIDAIGPLHLVPVGQVLNLAKENQQ